MQWSKIKTRLKGLICPELQDRVDFHMTRFREAHDQKGRAWVTIDGREVLDCSYYRWHMAVWNEKTKLLEEAGKKPAGKEYLQIHQIACERIKSQNINEERDFRDALLVYLGISIQDAIVSENPLIRAFTLIDRRMGKRTFEKLCFDQDDHPLIRAFYELRAEVFGMQFA